MALNLEALSNWEPFGFIESELGRIAVFELPAGAAGDLEVAARSVNDPVKFARHLARFACFPADNLRDGKYRPKDPIFDVEEISALSDSSLAKMARFFVKDNSEGDANLVDAEQILSLLKTQFQDHWRKHYKMIHDTMSPFRGLSDGFLAIDSQIKTLNRGVTRGLRGASQKPLSSSPGVGSTNTNLDCTIRDIANLQSSRWGMLADAASDLQEIREGIKDTSSAIRQVAAIQEAMNAHGKQQVEAEEMQRLITRGQNRLVIWMTGITLAATVFIGPTSRLACAASRSTRFFKPVPFIELGVEVVCGF